MLRHLIAGMALVIVMVLAPLAVGQTMPNGKWWKDRDIARQLNLTANDVNQLDTLFVKSRRSMIDLKNRVEKEQFEYQNLMESKTLDETAINRQLQRLEQARAELNEERSRFIVGVRKILGRDRFQRLQQIYAGSR
jgi:Spy/CpxP family protein refolding chaperone